MREVFKDITGYEGLYQVSNLGRVKSLDKTIPHLSGFRTVKGRILKPGTDGHGYYNVTLRKNKKQKTPKVHKLVAIAFHSHKPNGNKLVVDHINEIKTDNRAENLRIVTHRFNCSRKKVGTSKYIGVCFYNKYKKWRAQIKINGKQKHLGYFICELEAHQVYQNALKTINK